MTRAILFFALLFTLGIVGLGYSLWIFYEADPIDGLLTPVPLHEWNMGGVWATVWVMFCISIMGSVWFFLEFAKIIITMGLSTVQSIIETLNLDDEFSRGN